SRGLAHHYEEEKRSITKKELTGQEIEKVIYVDKELKSSFDAFAAERNFDISEMYQMFMEQIVERRYVPLEYHEIERLIDTLTGRKPEETRYTEEEILEAKRIKEELSIEIDKFIERRKAAGTLTYCKDEDLDESYDW
ncbi:MAG: hypothetical protein ACK5LM_05205, partial [Lactovum sp.]